MIAYDNKYAMKIGTKTNSLRWWVVSHADHQRQAEVFLERSKLTKHPSQHSLNECRAEDLLQNGARWKTAWIVLQSTNACIDHVSGKSGKEQRLVNFWGSSVEHSDIFLFSKLPPTHQKVSLVPPCGISQGQAWKAHHNYLPLCMSFFFSSLVSPSNSENKI